VKPQLEHMRARVNANIGWELGGSLNNRSSVKPIRKGTTGLLSIRSQVRFLPGSPFKTPYIIRVFHTFPLINRPHFGPISFARNTRVSRGFASVIGWELGGSFVEPLSSLACLGEWREPPLKTKYVISSAGCPDPWRVLPC
jgi:hypothetical protein